MSTYKPGTIAVATVGSSVTPVRVVRYDGGWARLDDPDYCWSDERDVTSVTIQRTLVVLDLADMPVRPRMSTLSVLRQWEGEARSRGQFVDANVLGKIAAEIEAQTKPRIPEPGLWGVVEATLRGDEKRARLRYVRTAPAIWLCVGGAQRTWRDLVDPVLIRDGIEDGAR